jgi:glutathione peroxidase
MANAQPSDRTVYEFTLNSIDKQPVPLANFKGKVLLIVNVASRCGFTPQYKGLEAIYLKYKDQGLEILGFPANDFLWQEPGDEKQIKEFCTLNYEVTFPMFAKLHVKGGDIAPLYAYLTGATGESVSWNFNKFLVGRDGKVVTHFGSKVTPEDPALVGAIEAQLKAK